VLLLRDGETKEDLLKLSKEELLLRWINYHLARSNYKGPEIRNFTEDIKNSVAYTHLLKQISPAGQQPALTLNALTESDLNRRAGQMLSEAEKLKAREFVSPEDVVNGNHNLNLAFVANLFNKYPALDAPVVQDDTPVIQETREEKQFRNWMNSLGVEPYVNYLYYDLRDSLIIFQLYDMIKPGSVDWKRVIKKVSNISAKQYHEKLGNCNYAVELGQKMNFSLVNIQGSNILEGNKTLTLGLVWQLMRAYTLALLNKISGTGQPIVEQGIIEWVNEKLKSSGKKTFIKNFSDSNVSNSVVILDLIDAIKPSSIKYDLIKSDNSLESKMSNALFAISSARKIGARIYALPEDIVEVKTKMVLTIFACLMVTGLQKNNE
jgi:hypothetical protein